MPRRAHPVPNLPEPARSALDMLAQDLLLVDQHGRIVFANRALAGLLGRTPGDLTGLMVHKLPWQDLHGTRPAKGELPWEVAGRKQEQLRHRPLWLTDKFDARRAFLVSCSPIQNDAGAQGGVMIRLDDVTQLDEAEIEVRRSGAAAERAGPPACVSLADMSHEIRTSLNTALGFTELLRRGQVKDDADWRRQLDIVHSSSTYLLDLINNVLDVSRVESGLLAVEHTDCAPYQIAREVVRAQSGNGYGKPVSVELRCPGSIPASIQTDPVRLRRILANLVSHVVKLADHGTVALSLRFSAARPEARLLFEIGISPLTEAGADAESALQSWAQSGRPATQRLAGIGLGLTLSHQLARALGAELSVRHTQRAGSSFVLSLPAGPIEAIKLITPERAAAQEEDTGATSGSRWVLPGIHVLIVDDGPENRELARLVLEDAGALTDQAANGLVAVEKAQTRRYDLILMDLQMPGLDGVTATRLLRQYGLDTPIVALTAQAIQGQEQDIINAGCTACLAKPTDIDQLLATVAGLAGGSRVFQALNKPAEMPINSSNDRNLPHAPIVSRLAGNARLQPAIDKFLARLGDQLSAIEQAWLARDFAALASLAHWLKGAGGTVGFDMFTEPAKKLEQLSKARLSEGMEEVVMELNNISARIARPQAPPEARTSAHDSTRTGH